MCDRGRRWKPGSFWARLGEVVAISGLLTLSACTYSFTGTNLPSHVKTLAIPSFQNQSDLPGIEQEVTSALTSRFIEDGRLKIASSGAADARLDGEVVRYENKVNTYSGSDDPIDYVVIVTLSMVLRDQVKNRELWKDEALTATSVWDPAATSGLTNEEDARAEAIEKLTSDVITQTLEQW